MPRVARRRRKRFKVVKRVQRPSRYFQCPRCGAMTLTVDFKKINESEKLAIVRCGTCKLYCEFRVPAVLDRVDVYNKVVDLAYDGRLDECSKPSEGAEAEGAERPVSGEAPEEVEAAEAADEEAAERAGAEEGPGTQP